MKCIRIYSHFTHEAVTVQLRGRFERTFKRKSGVYTGIHEHFSFKSSFKGTRRWADMNGAALS